MLDPVEQKKGGFRAFADRDRERQAARLEEAQGPVLPDIIAVTTRPIVPQADGHTRADKTTVRPSSTAR